MNIGFYCGALFPPAMRGGIQSYVLRLAREIGASGKHQVHLLTDREPDASWTPMKGVTLHTVRTRWVPVLGRWLRGLGESRDIAKALRRLAREHALDVVEFPNWEAPGLVYTRTNDVPSVTRLSTCFAETMKIDALRIGWGERFIRWSERTAARRSTALVTHTQAHRAYMAREIGLPESSIAVIPLGIEVPEQPLPPVAREPDAPVEMLYVGRLEHRKGTLDLLHALPRVAERAPAFRLTLIGRDRRHAPGRRTFREYAEQELPAAIRERLVFRDVVGGEELDTAYRDCDLFVAPSLYESFGLTYIEAMRYARPAIGCRAGGIPEVVRHGHTGLLVEPSRPEELAEAMVSLLTQADLRRTMGLNAHAWTRENFSIQVMAERMIAFYEDVRTRHRKAAP